MKFNISNMTVALAAAALGAASCTANYEDINRNPYEVTAEDMERDGYAMRSFMTTMQSWVIPADVNQCQFTDLLLGGPYGGYIADANSGFNTGKFSTYDPQSNWSPVFYRVIYTNEMSNFTELCKVTEDENAIAVAKVVKVAGVHRVADTYGPIPYTQVGTGADPVPLDSEKEVFKAMFADLDAAVEVLTRNRAGMITTDADRLYGGSLERWGRLANSLKLRLAMRIVYTDFTTDDGRTPQQLAEEAVSSELGVIEDNSGNAMYTGFGKDGNPLYTACMYNSPAGSVTGGDSHAAADIICYMNGYEDPRREKYFSKAQFSGDNALEYVGMRRGIAIPALSTVGLLYSGVNFVDGMATPLQWMNAAEVAFLKAEAVGVFGWNMGGSAKTFYEQGVRLSFEQWGVAGVDEYLVGTTLPESYTDPNGGATSYSTQLSQLGVAWNDSASKEEMQERIIIQKWIANFHLGNEAWADFRRTGFPHLIPAMESAVGNNSQGIRNLTLGARRMSYPADEATNNPENYAKAVEMLGGSDNMATRMWWDCNPAVK